MSKILVWVRNEWFEWVMDAVGRLRPGVVCSSGQAGIGKQTPAGIGHYARILTQIYPLILLSLSVSIYCADKTSPLY